MARPKKTESGPSALERIENAFWEMLAEMPYESITITELARRAHVNHNTIYYHYECIDQMAVSLFEKDIPSNVAAIFSSVIASGDSGFQTIAQDKVLLQQWKKAYLFLRSGSPFLMNHLKSKMFEFWCQAMDIRQENLTETQKVELEFIFSGMAAAMRYSFDIEKPAQINILADRPLGHAIRMTLADMKVQ